MSDLAIEAHQLTKRCGDVTAVDGFNLAVTAGTVVRDLVNEGITLLLTTLPARAVPCYATPTASR